MTPSSTSEPNYSPSKICSELYIHSKNMTLLLVTISLPKENPEATGISMVSGNVDCCGNPESHLGHTVITCSRPRPKSSGSTCSSIAIHLFNFIQNGHFCFPMCLSNILFPYPLRLEN